MAPHNMSWVHYPSLVSGALEEVISAQSVAARALQVYAGLCLPLALTTGLFNLVVLLRGRRAQPGGLDTCLLDLVATQLLGALLSLSALSRPGYLATTHLGCAALSFLGNLCSLNAQLLPAAMLFLFLPPGPACWLPLAARGARRPTVGLAALGTYALAGSLGLAALLGMAGQLGQPTLCQLDPLTAWPEYEFTKLGLGLGVGLGLELAFCGLLVARWVRGEPRPQEDPASACQLVYTLVLTSTTCRLPYSMALLQRGLQKLRGELGSPRDELLLNLAELLLFAEAAAVGLLVLLLHPPCKAALLQLLPCTCPCSCPRQDPDSTLALGESLGQTAGDTQGPGNSSVTRGHSQD
ncbi:uncharacterized protein LOC132533121 [Erinaceus europaeus]|uniref:Uncharacterized protein LOC132533121 n=1 Tax=Erinaceus europaeus TaxID=9365 RepID=A0ABM3VXX1_ERIEU|nr:uncharacterized protein LOC132533121 [Erinaceus europaeus]